MAGTGRHDGSTGWNMRDTRLTYTTTGDPSSRPAPDEFRIRASPRASRPRVDSCPPQPSRPPAAAAVRASKPAAWRTYGAIDSSGRRVRAAGRGVGDERAAGLSHH